LQQWSGSEDELIEQLEAKYGSADENYLVKHEQLDTQQTVAQSSVSINTAAAAGASEGTDNPMHMHDERSSNAQASTAHFTNGHFSSGLASAIASKARLEDVRLEGGQGKHSVSGASNGRSGTNGASSSSSSSRERPAILTSRELDWHRQTSLSTESGSEVMYLWPAPNPGQGRAARAQV
jgi:hypothetical protein